MNKLINSVVLNKVTQQIGVIIGAPKEPAENGNFFVDVQYPDGKQELLSFKMLDVIGELVIKQMYHPMPLALEKKVIGVDREFTINEYGHVAN